MSRWANLLNEGYFVRLLERYGEMIKEALRSPSKIQGLYYVPLRMNEAWDVTGHCQHQTSAC